MCRAVLIFGLPIAWWIGVKMGWHYGYRQALRQVYERLGKRKEAPQ